jgi:hypothetical protein
MNRGLATADVVQRRGCSDTARQKRGWESVFSIPALHPIRLNLADGIEERPNLSVRPKKQGPSIFFRPRWSMGGGLA